MNSLMCIGQAIFNMIKILFEGAVRLFSAIVDFIGEKIYIHRRKIEKERRISRLNETLDKVVKMLMLVASLLGLISALITLFKNAKKLFD